MLMSAYCQHEIRFGKYEWDLRTIKLKCRNIERILNESFGAGINDLGQDNLRKRENLRDVLDYMD